MKQNRLVRVGNVAISLVAAAAWLLASNHCAVAALTPRTISPSAHEHCPGHQAPAKHDDKGEMECCKTLTALSSAISKNFVGYEKSDFLPVDFPIRPLCGLATVHATVRCEWDTGPPGIASFAELVLQRSILAHAPPVSLS